VTAAQPSPELRVLSFLAGGRAGEQNIYQAIGVEPVINCRGTFTIIGGSVERPEVLAAMEAAAGFFVQYDELAMAVGQRLAELTGAEWGLVSSGCAAGMKHVTAACVTGGNPEKLIRIPDLTGCDKTQVIVPRFSRNAYDHAVRNIGVELVTVETLDELAHAISPRTAMIYVVTGGGTAAGQPFALQRIAQLAAPRGIPILADAAAEDLTIPNVHLQAGASAVTYSGGKALCGPQCAGLVLGRKDLLMAAWQASAPHHGPGRDDKVGKEEILGLLAAVEAWIARDHAAEWQTWLSWLDTIAQAVAGIPSVETHVEQPGGLSNRAPTLVIGWDPAALQLTGEEVAEDCARHRPRIAVGAGEARGKTCIRIAPNQMRPGDAEVVAARVQGILTASQPPRPATLLPPAANVSGHWELRIQYFASSSLHRLVLRQEGNWVDGTHQSDFSVQPLHGTVEGDQVRLRSDVHRPGDWVPFIFAGAATADRLEGTVHLGEYLTATFVASRVALEAPRRRVMVPGGPPLAT